MRFISLVINFIENKVEIAVLTEMDLLLKFERSFF